MIEYYQCGSCAALVDQITTHKKFCSGLFPRSDADLKPQKKQKKSRTSGGEKRRLMLQARDGPGCQECGSMENLTTDHKLPLSRGGTNGMKNTWVLCFSCNNEKGDMTVEEWRAWKADKKRSASVIRQRGYYPISELISEAAKTIT